MNIDASVTEGVSFSTYLDEDASIIWRTWADTGNQVGTYSDSDFIGTTIIAAQFVSGLEKVLVNKEYFI